MKERHDLLSCPGISTHRLTELTDRRAKGSTAAAFFLSESVQEDAQHIHWEEPLVAIIRSDRKAIKQNTHIPLKK